MEGLDSCLTPTQRRLWLYCVDKLKISSSKL